MMLSSRGDGAPREHEEQKLNASDFLQHSKEVDKGREIE